MQPADDVHDGVSQDEKSYRPDMFNSYHSGRSPTNRSPVPTNTTDRNSGKVKPDNNRYVDVTASMENRQQLDNAITE